MTAPCEPGHLHSTTTGWHWVRWGSGVMEPAEWQHRWTTGHGRVWLWHIGGKHVRPEVLAAHGFTYECPALTPEGLAELRTDLQAAVNTLEFGRAGANGRSPAQHAAHLMRLTLDRLKPCP